MAVVFNKDEENQQDQQGSSAVSTASPSPESQSAPVGGAQQQSSNAFSANKNNQPSTNLRKYIDANKDNNVGSKIANNVNKEIGDASNRFSGIKSTFDQAQEAAQNRLNQGQQVAQQIQNDPTQVQNNQQYQQLRDADKTDINALNTQFQQAGMDLSPVLTKAQQDAANYGTEAGRFQLLQNMFGQNRPNYSMGQQKLDQLLLQTQPGLRQNELALQSASQNLGNQVNQFGTNAQNALTGLNTQAGDVSTAIRNALLGGEQSLQDTLNQRATEQNAAQNQANQDFLNRYNNNQLTLDDLQRLGYSSNTPLDDLSHTSTTNFDLNNYITKGADLSAADVASQNDINRLAALRQLAGDEIGSQYDLSLPEQQAAARDIYNVNAPGVTSDLSGRYQSLFGTPEGYDPRYGNFNFNNIEGLQQYANELAGIARQPGTNQTFKQYAQAQQQRVDDIKNSSLLQRLTPEQRAIYMDQLNSGNIK